jgi:selenide,water dikinase
MPLDKLPTSVIRAILAGGESVCAAAGIPVAGGHSIDTLEPIYGLVALGLVHPDKVKKNSSGKDGDILVLGKPLGVGILSAALKNGRLDDAGYRAMIDTTVKLNRVGPDLARLAGVHAMTDVTGFGLLGHLLEMCRGSGVGARLHMSDVPLLDNVLALAEAGVITGASARNWASYGSDVRLAPHLEGAARALLCDPQTSGGLLVACAENAASEALELFRKAGFAHASVIGKMVADKALVHAD